MRPSIAPASLPARAVHADVTLLEHKRNFNCSCLSTRLITIVCVLVACRIPPAHGVDARRPQEELYSYVTVADEQVFKGKQTETVEEA